MYNYEAKIIEMINAANRRMQFSPLILGGITGSGGGIGGPTGGFIGVLPQTRVSYDLSELSDDSIPVSGVSLLDNLNHIRYRISTVEDVVTSGGGTGGGHLIQDEGIDLAQRDTLNFVGTGVIVTDVAPIIGVPPSEGAALAFDAQSSTYHTSGSTYLQWNHTIGSGNDRVLVVGIAMRAVTATSVTFNGINLTKKYNMKPGGDVNAELWYLLEADMPSAGTYVIRVNGSTSQQWVAGAVSYFNCSGLGSYDSGWGSSTSSLAALSTTVGNVVVDILALQSSNATLAPTSPQVERWDKATSVNRGGMSTTVVTSTTTGTFWTFNSDTWATVSVELLTSPGSGGVTAVPGYTLVTISGYTETDPIYSTSEAANITSGDITKLGNTSGVNTGDQVGDGITILGTGTVGDPFVAATSGVPISGVQGVEEAPIDGSQYTRQDGNWTVVTTAALQIDQSGGTGITYGILAGNINGTNTGFMVSLGRYTSGKLMVYLNGLLQFQGTEESWVEILPASGTFAFISPPLVGDSITVTYT